MNVSWSRSSASVGVAALRQQIAAQPSGERRVQRVERLDLAVEIRLHVRAQLGFDWIGPHAFLCSRSHAGYAIGAVLRAGLKNGVFTTVAGTRWRTASTVTSNLERGAFGEVRRDDGRQRNQLLQHRRPGRGRGAADLAAAAVDRHGDARGGGGDGGARPRRLVERFDLRPVDLEADDLPRRPAALLPRAARRWPMNGRLSSCTSRPSPISNGEYFCASIIAFLLLKKSTSISSSPASTRATSSASMPAGLMSNGAAAVPSARPRPRPRGPTASRSRSRDRRCSRCARCPPARRRSCRCVTRKYFRPSMSASATARAAAPRSDPAARAPRPARRCPRSSTSRPVAFCVNQRRLGSAAVQRNVVLRQPRHRAVVDHLAVLVAPRRVVHLADGDLERVARDQAIDELDRVAAGDQVLEERRDVDQRRGVADRVVLVLVVRLVGADRVVARPLAIVEALAQREACARGRRLPIGMAELYCVR